MKFRLIVFAILLAMIGVLLRFFFAIPMIEKRVQELAEAQQLSIASYAAQKIDEDLRSRHALIQRFAEDFPVSVMSEQDRLDAWVRDRQSINPAFDIRIIAIRPDGHGVLAAYPPRAGLSSVDFAASPWFQDALRGKTGMSRPLPAIAGRAAALIFGAPVRDASGSVVAVLAGVSAISGPGFLDHLQRARLGATGGFLLVSPADHLFVAATDPTMAMQPTPPGGVNLLHDRAMGGYRGVGLTVNARGVQELSAMASVPSAGWFVVARMPTEEALRPVTAVRGFTMISNTLLAITIIGLLLVMLPRILRPLTDTAGAIRDMADGKIPIEPLPVRRADEVGQLVSGFNVLVARLKREELARETSEARLNFLAHHDYLTGLYNRVTLEDSIARALDVAQADGSQIALLFCDLDGFKDINDRHGHQAGDAVLQQVATRLSADLAQLGMVARIGGDEFVVLLTGLPDARAAALAAASQFLELIASPFHFDGHELALGVSIGVSLYTGASSPVRMMERADAAMYQAKRSGKGQLFFADDLDS